MYCLNINNQRLQVKPMLQCRSQYFTPECNRPPRFCLNISALTHTIYTRINITMYGDPRAAVLMGLLSCSVRPSTPFSADTDTPIFCCQSNTIPIFLYASRADVAPRDWQIKGCRRRRRNLQQRRRRGPVKARRQMPLICHGQSNTATISKV